MRPAPESDQREAQVTIFNATNDVLPLGRQSLHSNYAVACSLVAYEPNRFLGPEHLTTPVETRLLSGIEVPLRAHRDGEEGADTASHCHFSFVSTDDGRLNTIATAWPRDLPRKTFYGDVDAPANVLPEPLTLIADAEYDEVADEDRRPWRHRPCDGDLERCSEEELEELLAAPRGARYHWSEFGDFPTRRSWNPTSIDEMPVDDPADECHTGRDATPLRWDDPPSGMWRITSVDDVTVGIGDGDQVGAEFALEWNCYDVRLQDGQSQRTWNFCGSKRMADTMESAYKRGDVFVEFFTESMTSSPPAAYEALTVELDRRTDDGQTFETETIEAIQGYGIPEHLGLSWNATAQNDCEPRREIPECDQVILPARLQIDTSGGRLDIPPGAADFLAPDSMRRLEFVRGIYRVVADLRCTDERVGPGRLSHPGPYMELVYFAGPSAVD